jgi:hypothetical protein
MIVTHGWPDSINEQMKIIDPRANPTGTRRVELDPLYVDVIARRYEVTTGNSAILIETGEAFEVLAARRSREAAPV